MAARGPGGSPPTGAGSRTGPSVRPVTRPAALPDVPWLAQRGDGRWEFGRGQGGAVRILPAEETALAIDPRLLATVLPDGHGRSTIRLRDAASGRRLAEVAAPIWVSAGAWTPRGLVVTGYGDASMTTDGGLLLVDPTGTAATALVAGGAFSAALGHPVARGEVLVSPNGATVASNACGIDRCDLQVVDLATGAIARPIRAGEGFLRAITDDAVVTTDGDGAWIRARRPADGSELWSVRDRALIDPVAAPDGSVVGVVGSGRAGWAVSTIDRAGRVHDLGPRAGSDAGLPRIWRSLSAPTAVVVGHATFEEFLDAGRTGAVLMIAPGSGGVTSMSVDLPTAVEAPR